MAKVSAEYVAYEIGLAADELSKPCDSSIIPSLGDCFRRWKVIFGSLLSEIDIDDVNEENTTGAEKRIAALRKWRDRKGREATYKVLVDALLDRGERHQAENLCHKILAHHSMSDKNDQTTVIELNEYLLSNVYGPEGSETLPGRKFPYLPNRKFITLAMIEKESVNRATADGFTKGTLHGHADEIANKKTPIKLEAVFEPQDGRRHLKCVFVEGAPGIGKSTFALELCRRQKEVESMKKYSLVILLRLREKGIQDIQTIGMVFESICQHDKRLQQCLSKEVTTSGGEKILFILDGFDELPTHLRKDSFFTKLIRGQCLPACTVLVTSRPSASADLLPCIKHPKHVEIIGFTKDDIQQYAESMLNDQPEMLEDFLKYISDNPPIRGMMYIPLNSAIVLEIYKMNRMTTGKHIPQTMTELYTDLCRTLLMKGLTESNHPLVNQVSYDTALDDLPQCIKDQVLSLGELAFNGALEQKITFTRLPEGCDDLGFMNVSTGLFLGRKSYSFLHLTVQEFLAAYYFSQLPPNEQKLKFICNSGLLNEEESVSKWAHLDIMWKFVAGLTGFKNIGWKLVHKAISTRRPSNSNLFIIHCLYELQKEEEIKDICDNLFHEITVVTPLDCYLAGYCIAVSRTTWNVYSKGNGDDIVEMLSRGLNSVTDSENFGSIEYLDLSFNNCTKKMISHLNNFDSLLVLDICHNKLNNSAFDELSEIVSHTLIHLKSLFLHQNPGGDGAMVKLLPKLTQLQVLNIDGITLGLRDVQALSELLKSSKCLEELTIGDPYMTEECVTLMVEILLSPSSLKEVTINSVKWTTGNIHKFSLLQRNKRIQTLWLHNSQEQFYDDRQNIMINPVIPAVAKALHKNDSLVYLGIRSDSYEDRIHKSVLALSEMLRVNTTLKHLDVFVPLTCDDIQVLVSALQVNDTLERIQLWNERIVISQHRHLESTTHQSSISDDQSRWKPSAPYSSDSFTITNKASTIEWKGHGLKIHIPDNSLAPSLDPSIRAQLDVHTHMFANDSKPLAIGYVPVSSLYSIQMGAGTKLCRPVTIEFQHCLDISDMDISDLVILRAADITECFEPIDDAVFDRRTDHEYGEVTVPKLLNGDEEYDDFSWFIVAIRGIFLPNTIRYKAHVYTSKMTMNLKMYFIVTMALEPCTMIVERQYPEVSYDLQASFSVEFDTRRRLSLDIPEDGKKLESGWEIIPHYNPSITKQQVDTFCIFHNNLPKCELLMQWRAVGSPPERLVHKIDLTEGTANTRNYFSINFDPVPVSPTNIDGHSSVASTAASSSRSYNSDAEQTECQVDISRNHQLNERNIVKYIQIIPNEDLVNLGLQLGLDYNKLRRRESTENFCLNLISSWLREEDYVRERSGKPSWESLAKALEEIGHNGIARTIRDTIIANHH